MAFKPLGGSEDSHERSGKGPQVLGAKVAL